MKSVASKMILGLAALSIAGFGTRVSADDAPAQGVTFYKDVLPILQQNCQTCHRSGGTNLGGMVAPMALMTYQDMRPWVKAIVKQVSAKNMPPWHATPEFHGVFSNERVLTAAQIETITKWATSGAPAGDAKDAPAPVTFPTGEWAIGKPDLILTMPEKYTVKDEVEDLYQNFSLEITKEMLPEPRFVNSLEFRGGSPVVHHIIGYVVDGGTKTADRENGERADRGMIGGIAPGNDPDVFPDGYGFLIKPGQKFIFAMHYHKEKGPGTAVDDQSLVALKFAPKNADTKSIHIDAVGNHDFEIPAGNPAWEVGMARTLDRPIRIFELMPHMHLRGSKAIYTAYYPDGKVEKLLDVPRYDFNWQTAYEYKEPKVLPKGTRLEVRMTFDNSTNNPANPDPTKAIRFGGPTTDEMALGWLTYAYADETPATSPAVGGGGE